MNYCLVIHTNIIMLTQYVMLNYSTGILYTYLCLGVFDNVPFIQYTVIPVNRSAEEKGMVCQYKCYKKNVCI